MLWVAPPGTTPEQAAAYRQVVDVPARLAALAAVDVPAVNAGS